MNSLIPVSQMYTANYQGLNQPFSSSSLGDPNALDFQMEIEEIRNVIFNKDDKKAKDKLAILFRTILRSSSSEYSDQEKHRLIKKMLIDLRNACRSIDDPWRFTCFTIDEYYESPRDSFDHSLYWSLNESEKRLAKKYSNLYAFYFSLDIAVLKKQNESLITCNKAVLIFNQVVNDGFGDFTIALSLCKAYRKVGIKPQWMVVSDQDHLEKIKEVFRHSIEEMVLQDVCINWIVDAKGIESARNVKELAKKDDTIIIAASTGYRFFSRGDRIDCLDEMHPNDLIGRLMRSKTDYCKDRLSIKLGFSFNSAGVFLPEKTTYPFELALDSAGCLYSIQNKINKPNAPLSEILRENDITIMYMKSKKAQKRYISFISEYRKNSGKSIHIIVPTSKQKKLAISIQEVAPGAILYYHPFLRIENFQAIVQQATVSPGVTGNSSWLDAVVGEVPFFFDMGMSVAGIAKEFIDFCLNSDLNLDSTTEQYLNFMSKMATPWSQYSDAETKQMAFEMYQHRQKINSDLKKIHQHILNDYNAGVVMCNRLRELSET